MAVEGGEHHAAPARLTAVVEQATGHTANLPCRRPPRHRGNTLKVPMVWCLLAGSRRRRGYAADALSTREPISQSQLTNATPNPCVSR